MSRKTFDRLPEAVRKTVRAKRQSPHQHVATFICPDTGKKESVSAGKHSELCDKILNRLADIQKEIAAKTAAGQQELAPDLAS